MSESNTEFSPGINVEVGVRDNAYLPLLRDDLLSGNKALYIDNQAFGLEGLQSSIDRGGDLWDLARPDGKAIAVQADALQLPASKESIGVILAANFFGAEGHPALGSDGKIKEGNFTLPPWETIVNSWKDRLQSDGKVVILEVATPAPSDKLISTFESSGFQLKENHRGQNVSNIFRDKVLKSLHTLHSDPNEVYALVFQKKS